MIAPAWLFVLASTIAVLGILYAYKNIITIIQIRNENENLTTGAYSKLQSSFFLRVALIEAIPILLVIFGFIQMQSNDTSNNVALPLLTIIAILSYAFFNVFVSRNDALTNSADDPEEYKNFINTLTFTGLAMIMGVPAISVVGMFLF
ncbi:hypothetical protein GH741_13215 [Aquibacillus halophilus]|uniref:Uncharacterized protein n=1 Tax=Aquibacillus halophilus TaxID=930132 RepID=A0A6A8DIQ3_9BACI|nr:hypothetical protein [Aquibacillus halophilus]MRH43631.1 hypothetical protein [Aquibacillus halophilus]